METTLTQLSDALAGTVDRVAESTITIHARPRASSSGVVWQTGVVVTADHTIQFDEVHVRLPDGSERNAAVAGRDRATDIAVLRVDGADAVPPFADPASLKAGHLALAVGRTVQGVTAAMGIVSTVGGSWRTWRGGLIDQFIRLDIALYASSSGAAVADATGSVVGIATSGLSRTSALAIPRTTIDQVVSELLARGHVARGYLGVGLQPVRLPEHLKDKLESKQESGVIVLTVEPGGPAERGGLMIGDVILELNNRAVADTEDMQGAIASTQAGVTVIAKVLRGGEARGVNIAVGERPRKD